MTMEGLLTPLGSSYSKNSKLSPPELQDALVEVPRTAEQVIRPLLQASTPEQALEVLRSEPDYESLASTLKYLTDEQTEFDITAPSPLASQLVHILVTDVLPNYWAILNGKAKSKVLSSKKKGKSSRSPELDLLLSCLRSVTGLNAILLNLKQQIQLSKGSKKTIGGPKIEDSIRVNLQALQSLLDGDDVLPTFWNLVHNSPDASHTEKALWDDFSRLLTGKVVGIAAEASDTFQGTRGRSDKQYWIADENLYSLWLARNMSYWARSLTKEQGAPWKGCSGILSKSFRLGHTEHIIKEILGTLLLKSSDHDVHFSRLVDNLPGFEQRNMLYILLKIASRDFLSLEVTTEADDEWWKSDASIVSAVAALIRVMLADNELRKSHLVSWLTGPSGAGLGGGISIRRAAIAGLAEDKVIIETVLEKSLKQFGDQLYIRHTPAMQQEAHAQVLLLSAGYFHRLAPLRLSMLMRSGAHLSVVSNRLAASSPRARFLGMVVGEALSSLVDKDDKKMDFKMEEMDTPEALWYKSLVKVLDTVGSLDPLRQNSIASLPKKRSSRTSNPEVHAKPAANLASKQSKIIVIEEIEDDEGCESDDDDLVSFAKPDSDVEDSEEDATLVTRNKPTAPVYIRDLISYLRDTENYDRQKLGLMTAASLIRRKANFGTEVSAHAEELASLLVGIQDKYEIVRFDELRLQGMIAVLIALPLKMGQWFSKTFFDGDYSLSQRASILTTLGLGARELGGMGSEDEKLAQENSSSFPSKSLPESMHKRFTKAPPITNRTLSPINNISHQLQNLLISPMATELADKLTGPSILKVRTFSSRMAVEAARKKPITNTFAKIVSEGFFFPLTGRFFMHLQAYGSSSRSNITFQPQLLSLFIKTLALLLHASGPSTLSLPQMTSEFWDLLLSLRGQSIGDVMIIDSLLFAFLTILEINEDKRRLVDAHGRQMLETQEWVADVFARFEGGGSEEDERVKMLAAGCLVRIREVVEKYQALLMGDLAGFQT